MECASKEEATFYAIHEGRKHIEHLLADAGCRDWKIEEKFSDIMVEISDVEDIQDVQEKTWMVSGDHFRNRKRDDLEAGQSFIYSKRAGLHSADLLFS